MAHRKELREGLARLGFAPALGVLGAVVLGGAVAWSQEQAPPRPLSPETQALVKQLDDRDPTLRQQAFIRLEALRDPATIPLIHQYLQSKSANTRAFSVRALAAIEGPSADPVLLERLQRDRHPYVRMAVILALEPFKDVDPAIEPALIGALRDAVPEVRMAAADAVSRFEDPRAREAILARWRQEHHRDVRQVLEDARKRLGLAD